MGEALDDGRLTDARLAGQDRVVLPPPHQDIDHLPDFLVAADDRIDLAIARLLGHVDGKLRQRLLLPHLSRGHRTARLSGRGAAADLEPVVGMHHVLGRIADDFVEFVRQRLEFQIAEFLRDRQQRITQSARLQDPRDEITRADLGLTEHQRAQHPTAFDRFLDMSRQIGNRGGAARQSLQRVGDIGGQPRRLDVELTHDPMQVGILQLQNLVQPVDQFDVRIAAHLAKNGSGLDRLVTDLVELAKECSTTYLGHDCVPSISCFR